MKSLWEILKATIKKWSDIRGFQHSACLAFYTLFSLAPILLIVLALAGLFWSQSSVQMTLYQKAKNIMGPTGAQVIKSILDNAHSARNLGMGPLLGILLAGIGATTILSQLNKSLNDIWSVRSKPGKKSNILHLIKTRGLALLIVVASGILATLSIVLGTGLSLFYDFISASIQVPEWILKAGNSGLMILVVTVLIAMVLKFLPDVRLKWRDVLFGAVVTGTLFWVGKYFISIYLSKSSLANVYGAAGSLVVMLLWVYYSSIIFFFGAALTQVLVMRKRKEIRTKAHAVRYSKELIPPR